MRRRTFIAASAAAVLGAGASAETRSGSGLLALPAGERTYTRAPRLRPGATVGLVTPANAVFLQDDLDVARESLQSLGLQVKLGRHVLERHGSLGGRDAERAADINAFFADPDVGAIVPVRGGWGSARLLPLLDYTLIRRHPKIVLGYSDITALLNGIHARTGLVTFHGPNAGGRWDADSVDAVRRVLFEGEAPTFANPKAKSPTNVLAQTEHRIRTITPGRTSGRLLGGNLTVLTTLLGSPYLPDFTDAILFLEDTGEDWYRIDRMLTALRLAGILERIRGFVFGSCADCTPGTGFASLTPDEIFADHVAPLGIPAWRGALIGHGHAQWTLPVGLPVDIDADAGTVALAEPAVV